MAITTGWNDLQSQLSQAAYSQQAAMHNMLGLGSGLGTITTNNITATTSSNPYAPYAQTIAFPGQAYYGDTYVALAREYKKAAETKVKVNISNPFISSAESWLDNRVNEMRVKL